MNKDFYNNFFASGFHHDWRDAPGKLVVLGYVLDNVHNKNAILDVGCGDGYFLSNIEEELNKRNFKISATGVDLSKEAVKLAESAYPDISFEVMDAEQMDIKDNSFDFIVSYGVFEHLSKPLSGIKEVSRVLKPGGFFAMMMPTIGFYRKDRLDEGWYEDLNNPPQMQWNYTRERWERFFFDANLNLKPVEFSVNYGAINPGNFYMGFKPKSGCFKA